MKPFFFLCLYEISNESRANFLKTSKSSSLMFTTLSHSFSKAEITCIIYNENKKVECELSQFLKTKTDGVKNFGCSDCECESHLYYFKNRNEAIESVQNAYKSIAMDFEYFKI